jgi:hypothetical protein
VQMVPATRELPDRRVEVAEIREVPADEQNLQICDL